MVIASDGFILSLHLKGFVEAPTSRLVANLFSEEVSDRNVSYLSLRSDTSQKEKFPKRGTAPVFCFRTRAILQSANRKENVFPPSATKTDIQKDNEALFL